MTRTEELEMLRASLHAIHTQVGVAISQVTTALERERADDPGPQKEPPRVFGQRAAQPKKDPNNGKETSAR